MVMLLASRITEARDVSENDKVAIIVVIMLRVSISMSFHAAPS